MPSLNLVCFALGLFLTGMLLQLIYWQVLRPILLAKLRYRLFSARDSLRLMMIRGDIGPNQPAYKVLEQFCNLFISAIEWVGVTSFLITERDTAADLRVKRDAEIISEAPLALREIYGEICTVAMGACIVNSPFWVPVIAAWLITAHWSNRSRNQLDRWRRAAMGLSYAIA